jgi:hypothetical protein
MVLGWFYLQKTPLEVLEHSNQALELLQNLFFTFESTVDMY